MEIMFFPIVLEWKMFIKESCRFSNSEKEWSGTHKARPLCGVCVCACACQKKNPKGRKQTFMQIAEHEMDHVMVFELSGGV